ncbi:MAG: hypothetical protein AAF698_00475 [Pseudomonadota bacterium]
MRLGSLTMAHSRRLRSVGVISAALLALAGCATTAVPSGTTTVDTSFERTTGGFSDGAAIEVAVAAREQEGNLALCGAWVFQPQSIFSRSAQRRALETGQVQIDGRTAFRSISRFTRVRDGGPLDGAQAQCLRTDQAWDTGLESAKVRVRFPRTVFERDNDSPGFRGIVFRERSQHR